MTHPTKFANGDEFCRYVYNNMGLSDPHCEHQGGGAWMAFDGEQPVATYNEEDGTVDFDQSNFMEQSALTLPEYQPMQLLREMMVVAEAKKVPLKKAAKSVYHRDYLKTKNKPYRKYDPKKHQENKGSSE